MTNLITAQAAFEALQKGKDILCRPAGDMLDFADLDQFPATVFAMSGYEYCIKPEMTELAGIQFTKPVFLSDLEVEQEIFVVMPSCILRTKFHPENKDVMTAINRGYGQLDLDSAIDQARAISLALGLDYVRSTFDVIQDGFNDKIKKQRGKKASQVKDELSVVEETTKDIADALECAVVITEGSFVSSSEDFIVPPAAEPDLKPDVNAQLEILLDAIRICQSEKELDSTCANLEKEGFSQEQIDQINLAKQERLTDLDAKEIDAAKTIEMPANYKSLHQTIRNAKTPEEVNAVINYTAKWTEDQRNVLLREMHSRLAEINQSKQPEKEPPALILQLQHAPDLKTLDELELEIPSRHADVHKTLRNMAKKRRAELTVPVTPSPEPDYLLGDYP
ncbi:hypothetical protein BUM88_07915 [Acinetobacter calcoaceticus]|uniref:hypothetical protein n=1 Tax=Acinetobacter calcoaceticus TaxID=471 RepID=UPI0009AC55AB|nr:hypothetical protein [Acinetobacter calcoaceticus]AQZ81539.1 hypothetical protein BUM88_07915 [Acinetobacter calcoaceticus]